MSVLGAIEFIALFGVAILNGLILISTINECLAKLNDNPENRYSKLLFRQTIIQGAEMRLRSVLMTALVAILGFMPMAASHGSGAEVQKPLATVVIGGIFSATFLTLVVLPMIFSWIHAPKQNSAEVKGISKFKKPVGAILVLLCLLNLTTGSVYADRRLKNNRDHIYVQLETPISVHTTSKGAAFRAKTLENYYLKGSAIPAGTVLTGHIIALNSSRKLLRPGFAQFDIEEVTFPSGHIVQLPLYENSSQALEKRPHRALRTRKLMHPDAVDLKSQLGPGLIFFATSGLLVELPLVVATSLPSAAILGIGTGVRSLEAIGGEYLPHEKAFHNRRQDNWPKRYGHGILRSFGLVGFYYLFKRSPNPNFSTTVVFPVAFQRKGMRLLFEAASQEPIPPTAHPLLP